MWLYVKIICRNLTSFQKTMKPPKSASVYQLKVSNGIKVLTNIGGFVLLYATVQSPEIKHGDACINLSCKIGCLHLQSTILKLWVLHLSFFFGLMSFVICFSYVNSFFASQILSVHRVCPFEWWWFNVWYFSLKLKLLYYNYKRTWG